MEFAQVSHLQGRTGCPLAYMRACACVSACSCVQQNFSRTEHTLSNGLMTWKICSACAVRTMTSRLKLLAVAIASKCPPHLTALPAGAQLRRSKWPTSCHLPVGRAKEEVKARVYIRRKVRVKILQPAPIGHSDPVPDPCTA